MKTARRTAAWSELLGGPRTYYACGHPYSNHLADQSPRYLCRWCCCCTDPGLLVLHAPVYNHPGTVCDAAEFWQRRLGGPHA
jgi:hypothetical protein